MNNQKIFYGIIGLLLGFAIGFVLANSINRNASEPLANEKTQASSNPDQQIQKTADIKENASGAMQPDVAQTLQRALNSPNDFRAQIQAGDMYRQIQNTDKANEFYRRAVAVHHDSFEDLTTLGNSFFDIKNYEEAENWYALALKKQPEDVNVRTDLGTTFMERKQPDYDRAIQEYRNSLEKDPNHENTLFNLSIALMRKGDADESRKTLERLEATNPGSSLIPKLKEKLNPTVK